MKELIKLLSKDKDTLIVFLTIVFSSLIMVMMLVCNFLSKLIVEVYRIYP